MTSFVERVSKAAAAVHQLFPPTPLQANDYLSKKYGARVLLKREDLTPVRSYKIRGAFNFFRHARAAGNHAELFVCASAGNHAQGFAFVCRHFGKKGIVYMPVTTPQQKIDKTKLFGGEFVEIRLFGDFFDDCYRASLEFAEASGAHMVPPFDHKDIIEGQATVAWEIADQMPGGRTPDIMVLPVGGGGLSAGVTHYFREIGRDIRYVFCEPAGAPSLGQSLGMGRRVKLESVDNFVDGAAVAEIGREPFRHLKDFSVDAVRLVPENRLCATMIEMLNIEGVVLEPAGALSIDALKDFPRKDIRGKTIVCVVSGGNFDFERLPDVKERALRFEGLKKYFVFRFPQRPGALRDFLDLLGPDDDIARFEYLKKSARNFGSVLIGIETKDRRNFDVLAKRFTKRARPTRTLHRQRDYCRAGDLMTVYLILFRGVGGATQLPTKPLREALTAAGFKDVATYINSGNAVLSSRKGAASVTADIAKITKKEFGFDKAIHAVTREAWGELIENNPFPDAVSIPKFLHAAVLADKPQKEKVAALRAFAKTGERIEVVGKVAYIHTPGGFSTSKLAEKFDKGIGVPNTARNWNTVIALAKMADAIK